MTVPTAGVPLRLSAAVGTLSLTETLEKPAALALSTAAACAKPLKSGKADCPVAYVTVIGVSCATSAPSAGLMETTLSLTDVGGSEVAAARVTFVKPACV